MEQNADLINKYVAKLNEQVAELNKRLIVLEVQLELANESLARKDEETAEQIRIVREEAATSIETIINNIKKEQGRELDAVIAQRAELQEEANQLRFKNAALEDELFALKQRKRKKTVTD